MTALADRVAPAALRVRIDSQVRLPLNALPAALVAQLQARFERPNPEHARARRAGRSTHGIPRLVVEWAIEDGWDGPELVLPRGQAGQILATIRRSLWGVEVDRDASEGDPLVDVVFTGELRGYQEPAVAALVDGVQGLVVAPCGAGKTEIGCAAVARVGRSALILVHTHDLAEQWRERLRLRLGVEAGLVGGGKCDVRPITVALLQTLARWDAPRLVACGRRFGVLIVDECHHVPCRTLAAAVNALPCRWRWGLTATPQREDGLQFELEWVLGPELYRIEQPGLIAAGHLVPAKIVQVRTGWTTDTSATEQYGQVIAELTADPTRNALIVELVAARLAQGGVVLVLSQRVAHCEQLAGLVRERGFAAEALTGHQGKRARRGALAALRESAERRCVIATQLADEGLDVPRLTTVLLATPARAQGKTMQRLGRVMRPCDGKTAAELVDLVDDVGVLRGQAKARLRAYRQVLGEVQLRTVDAPGATATGSSRLDLVADPGR